VASDVAEELTRAKKVEQTTAIRSSNVWELENFSVYKFSIDYPSVCRVEFNPKSGRDKGDVVFHFPDKERIFLTWGDLKIAEKKFDNAEKHAEHSLQAVKKSCSVKKMDQIHKDTLMINSHKASYNHVKLDEIQPGIFVGRRVITHETHSVHLHCNKSSRYFVIYTMLSPKAPEDFDTVFKMMSNSFKCH